MPRSLTILGRAGFSLALILPPQVAAQACDGGRILGRVLDYAGGWQTADGKTVVRGTPICSDTQLSAANPQQGRLNIIYSRSLPYLCEPGGRVCGDKEPRSQPQVEVADGPIKRLISAASTALAQRPPAAVFAVVRGASGPIESVLAINQTYLDISPAFASSSGSVAELTPLTPSIPASSMKFPIRNPSGLAGHLLIETILPGLYRLRILSAENGDPIGSAVAVLVVPMNEYANVSSAFDEVKAASLVSFKNMREENLHYLWTLYLYDLYHRAHKFRTPEVADDQ